MTMTDAEIAGYMNWRGPGAYTQHHMKRIKTLLAVAEAREREACEKLVDEDRNLSDDQAARLCKAIRARGQA